MPTIRRVLVLVLVLVVVSCQFSVFPLDALAKEDVGVDSGVGVDGVQMPLSEPFKLHQGSNLLQFAAYQTATRHPFRVSH